MNEYIVQFTDCTKTVVAAENGSEAMAAAETGGKTAMSAELIPEPRFEAVQWLNKKIVDAPLWFVVAEEGGTIRLHGDVLAVQTLDGVRYAEPGDWIIRGIRGELFPCKSDVYEIVYKVE